MAHLEHIILEKDLTLSRLSYILKEEDGVVIKILLQRYKTAIKEVKQIMEAQSLIPQQWQPMKESYLRIRITPLKIQLKLF